MKQVIILPLHSLKPQTSDRLKTMKNNSKKLILCFTLFIFLSYISYFLKYTYQSNAFNQISLTTHRQSKLSFNSSESNLKGHQKTNLSHIVFGIAASANLFNHRKEYIKLWWKAKDMRGIVWLDEKLKTEDETLLPQLMVSNDTSNFKYKNPKGHRSAIRISRIISETLRLGMKDVRWFVMGDDDTVFVVENLVRVLEKYDHNQFYYIGSLSESHLQNIYFSYNMAFGGGGFAISYSLAKALEKMQDRCIQRYPQLYGSDDRIQACMAELGVPLTKQAGFHQFDVYGSLLGLLTSHPITPLVSLHHLDLVEPIFPSMNRVEALKKLKWPMEMDSAGLMQQSICYDKKRRWTISVSWGYAVQIFRGVISPREMERPSRTFLNWYQDADYTAYPFNTRAFNRKNCQKPFLYYFSKATSNSNTSKTTTDYIIDPTPINPCKSNIADPAIIQRVLVYKKSDPYIWDKSPRRNCCKVLKTRKKGTMKIAVGPCREGDVIEL